MRSMTDITRTTSEWQVFIGESLRDARLAREMDQQSLADRASISRATLSKMENGAPTTVAALIKVVRALGRTDWFELLDETGGGISPLALARELSRQPTKRQRAPRKLVKKQEGPHGI
jgi:transcriptional regulator with XRE-family HTH domain